MPTNRPHRRGWYSFGNTACPEPLAYLRVITTRLPAHLTFAYVDMDMTGQEAFCPCLVHPQARTCTQAGSAIPPKDELTGARAAAIDSSAAAP